MNMQARARPAFVALQGNGESAMPQPCAEARKGP